MTGYQGTYVISWAQTEVDGQTGAPLRMIGPGALWRWQGQATQIDHPADVLLLRNPSGDADLRRSAARAVHKLVGMALQSRHDPVRIDIEDPLLSTGFEVTDGYDSFHITLIETGPHGRDLLMFHNCMPPADTDLWVVRANLRAVQADGLGDRPSGVICFTPGTRIRLRDGEKPVEMLREGDRVQTRDNGTQEVLWIGRRRISGARLFAMPELRPVRLHTGALGRDAPHDDLVVSPQHRLLLRDDRARRLFNTDEVLVEAQDLIDDKYVHLDHTLRDVTYFHVLLNRHEIVWANGVETESFHPANAALDSVAAVQRDRLYERFPDLRCDLAAYGDYARRTLSRSEAAILRGVGAGPRLRR